MRTGAVPSYSGFDIYGPGAHELGAAGRASIPDRMATNADTGSTGGGMAVFIGLFAFLVIARIAHEMAS